MKRGRKMSLEKVYLCPTDKSLQCSWEGRSEDILHHFIMEHEDLLLRSSEVDIDPEMNSENRLLFLDEEIYLIQMKIDDGTLKIGLRYLGPQRIAELFSYDIVLSVEGQKYFVDYFGNGPSIFQIVDGFWFVNLELLKLLHNKISSIQCNINISSRIEFSNESIADQIETREDSIISDLANVKSLCNAVIEDDEIDEILNDNLKLQNIQRMPRERDALDNFSSLNFNVLENDFRCRRYSSFLGIPQGLFEEKETTNLSCSNCYINMLPPIFICVNNHNICSDCKYQSCKICYESVTENRNRDLEEYSRTCLHLCRYHSVGCVESFMYNEIRNHELKCRFCIYKCINDCSFTGKFYEFQSHFKIKHSSIKVVESTPIDFPRNSEFFICDEDLGIFLCQSTLSKNITRWIVASLGPKDRSYSCEISFKGARIKNALILRKLEHQYSVAQSKEELKKMKVKDKNAVLTISHYFH